MQIAIVNSSNRRIGGVETYLNAVIRELTRAGHEIAFCFETNEPGDRPEIELPETAPSWCVADLGEQSAVTALRQWRPDVIYCHKLTDPLLEREIIGLAPSVYFAHDYNGMCVSGTKTFKFPSAQPCTRSFGAPCLLHYFPHRCGGLNPATMLKLYSDQSKRLENMNSYRAIVTHSDYMIAELRKHGLTAHPAYKNGYGTTARTFDSHEEKTDFNLVFSGRLEYLKGAHLLIDALPEVQHALNASVRLIIAGDGRDRGSLERQAARVRRERLEVDFAGWLERGELEKVFASCDLLVVPSIWPEPFGLVGIEAGSFGLPVAAFDVGGIHDWLSDGVNGFLAPGDPATSKGLAEAIIKCLQDPNTHASLRGGAFELAQRFSMQNHLAALLEVFSKVTGLDFQATSEISCETRVPVTV
jgi:glycosyltransferase involved in cell wall biosynthesis